MSQGNWEDNLGICCCLCGSDLKKYASILACPNREESLKEQQEEDVHSNGQQVWAWVFDRVVNYRIAGTQLSFKMSSSTDVLNVKYFPNSYPIKETILAENFQIDFSKIKTVQDYQDLLLLLKAYG
jgi:hypothetical protein